MAQTGARRRASARLVAAAVQERTCCRSCSARAWRGGWWWVVSVVVVGVGVWGWEAQVAKVIRNRNPLRGRRAAAEIGLYQMVDKSHPCLHR